MVTFSSTHFILLVADIALFFLAVWIVPAPEAWTNNDG
jgi:hypothetical protein